MPGVERLTRRQWLLLALLIASIFLNYVDRGALSFVAPYVAGQFSLNTGQLGPLLAAFFWTYALLQLFGVSGWIADHGRPGTVLAAGAVIWSAATILCGLAPDFRVLFAARLALGAGESLAYPCYSRIFATEVPASRRGLANALLDAGSKLGPSLGALLGGVLLARFSWRMYFYVLGLVSMLWLVPWLWAKPTARLAAASSPTSVSLLDILRLRSAWGTFLGHFCGNYFWFFLLSWLPTYLMKERGFALADMSKISSLAYFVMAAATCAAGWLSDRLIQQGASPTRVRKTVVVSGLVCSTLVLPIGVVENATVAVILLLLACASFGTYTSNHWAITQTLAGPQAAGRWTSLQNGVGNLAGVAAGWLTGIVVDRTHSFTLAFVIAGLVAFAGALLWGAVVGPVQPVKWKQLPSAALIES